MASRYEVIDGCPIPRKLFPVAAAIKEDLGGGTLFNSIYRGDDVAALLHKYGKHTQRELYDMWINHVPGALPANPPTQGTHILKSDAVAYIGPAGRPLKWWQCGMDIDDSKIPDAIAAFKERGWLAFQPYHTGSEYHHLNLAKAPRHLAKLITLFTTLKRGSKGRRVHKLTKQLAELGYMHAPTKSFGAATEKAVKAFQRHYHLTPVDGVVGPHTHLQLRAAIHHLHSQRGGK
jgi:hypothetical protein